MSFEDFSEKLQESQENNSEENEGEKTNEPFDKIKKYIEVSSWFTDNLPEGRSINNSYLKHEVNTLTDVLKKCELDDASDEYKELIKEITEKIIADLYSFNGEGMDRNDSGIGQSVLKNMEFVANAIQKGNKNEEGKISEEASDFNEAVESLNNIQQDIREMLLIEESRTNKHNHIMRFEACSLIDLLKKKNYSSAPEDCKLLLKEIMKTIQDRMNELDKTSFDEPSLEKIEEIKKRLVDFEEKYMGSDREKI